MAFVPPPTQPFPRVPPTLLAALDRVFPDRAPDSALSNDEIRERIGEARVLRFLKRQLARQSRASALSQPRGAARADDATDPDAAAVFAADSMSAPSRVLSPAPPEVDDPKQGDT